VHEVQKLEDGEEVKVYVALFGWKSVDHHLAFRETNHFKELRENMGQPKDLKKLEVVHVKVTEFKE
jgi:heme-degrading monooxygenase HmoA